MDVVTQQHVLYPIEQELTQQLWLHISGAYSAAVWNRGATFRFDGFAHRDFLRARRNEEFRALGYLVVNKTGLKPACAHDVASKLGHLCTDIARASRKKTLCTILVTNTQYIIGRASAAYSPSQRSSLWLRGIVAGVLLAPLPRGGSIGVRASQ